MVNRGDKFVFYKRNRITNFSHFYSEMKKNYYLIFFVISFLTNVIGPLIPDMITGFKLNLTLVSILPFAFFIAYGVMSIPSGFLIERYNEKIVMIAAFSIALAGSTILAFFPNYLSAIVSLFLIGSGMAMLQVVINPLLRTSGGEENFAFYSILGQLIFGIASFVSPFVYSFIVSNLKNNTYKIIPTELPWIALYFLFIVICFLMIIILFYSKLPKVELNIDEKTGTIDTYKLLFKQKKIVLFFISMICYVGTEQGIANWISQFLSSYHGLDPQTTGAETVAYFWGLMTMGGILGLFLVKLFDSRYVLIGFSFLAMVSLFSALFGTSQIALYAFPLVGFFASVMYPIIFSLALNSFTENHGSFSAILVTGIIGGAIMPLIVGWLGDILGLRFGMCSLFLTLGFILSIGFWAKPLVTNKTIKLF